MGPIGGMYAGDKRGLCWQAGSLIQEIDMYTKRHAFAAQLIEQGAHPTYIQEQLGHSSITITMDAYGHLFPNRNRDLVDGLYATPAQPNRSFLTS